MALVDLLGLFNQDELGQIIQSAVERYNLSTEQTAQLASLPPAEQAKVLEQLASLDAASGLGAGAGYVYGSTGTVPGTQASPIMQSTPEVPTYTPPTYESDIVTTGVTPLPADFFNNPGSFNDVKSRFAEQAQDPIKSPFNFGTGNAPYDNPMGGDVTSSVSSGGSTPPASTLTPEAYNARQMAANLLSAGGDTTNNLRAAENYLAYYMSKMPEDADPDYDFGVMSMRNTIKTLQGRVEGARAGANGGMTAAQASALAMQQAQLAEQQRQFDLQFGLTKDKFAWEQSQAESAAKVAAERELQRIKEQRAQFQLQGANTLSTAEAQKARLLGELAGRAVGNRQYWPGFEPGGTFANWSKAYNQPFTPQRMTPTTVDVGGITGVARDLVNKALAGVQ